MRCNSTVHPAFVRAHDVLRIDFNGPVNLQCVAVGQRHEAMPLFRRDSELVTLTKYSIDRRNAVAVTEIVLTKQFHLQFTGTDVELIPLPVLVARAISAAFDAQFVDFKVGA